MNPQKNFIIFLFLFSILNQLRCEGNCPDGCKEKEVSRFTYGIPTGETCTVDQEEKTPNDPECPYDCGTPEEPVTCYGTGTRICKVDGDVEDEYASIEIECEPEDDSNNGQSCGPGKIIVVPTGNKNCDYSQGYPYDCGEVSCSN